MMKKKKNADAVETELTDSVVEETKTSENEKALAETPEDIEKKAEEEATEIEAYDEEGNPILKKKKNLLFYPEFCRLPFQGRWFIYESNVGGW